MTNNTEQQAVPVAREAAVVAVTQEDRDAVQAFHHVMLLRLMSDVKSQRPKLGDDEGDAGTLVQAFARHRLTSLLCKSGEGAGESGPPCERCQGNGEIVTDWERYTKGHDGDKGDEGTADCPDCGGTGRVDTLPDATQTREAELVAAMEAIGKFVDDFHAPWGSWKAAWWEDEVSDDAALTENNALKHVANMARRAALNGRGGA